MKIFLLIATLFFTKFCLAQKAENLIVVTTDGFRWQEIFNGMDSAIANNSKYNEGDSAYLFQHYWAATADERRKKLMPFLWSIIEKQGQIYGNRKYNNNVDNANPYWFSYPGYSEIFTGNVDTLINTNSYKANPNTNVLSFLNTLPKFKNKVAAFGAWFAFDRILNEQESHIPVICSFDSIGGKNPNTNEKLITKMLQDSYKPFGDEECLDVFTHYAAMEYLEQKKPKVLYIGYGETDEWAHEGKYKAYLESAHQVDAWLKNIWTFIQNTPQYKNKTTLLFTTDHGRGDIIKKNWKSHNNKISDAHEIWFATIGSNIAAKGEIKIPMQIYQKQFAQTFAKLLGYTFTAVHPIADAISEIIE